ncbi:MAG: ATP-binding protein [Ktedonobacterales bacterium]
MLIDELRGTFLFAKLPEKQLQKLVKLGGELSFPAGEVLFVEGQPADYLWVLLEGHVELSRRVGGQRIVMGALDVPGTYAGGIRSFSASDTGGGYRATGKTTRPSRFFRLTSEELGNLLDELLPMAKHLLDGYIHTLEAIETAVRERGRLISLGTLAAGLTHELNNPAAAAHSASTDLRATVSRLVTAVGTCASGKLSPTQVQAMLALQAEAMGRDTISVKRSAIETGRLEEEQGAWLEEHAVANPWDLAPTFVAAGIDRAWLDAAAQALGPECLSDGLNWVGDTLLATSLLDQIDDSTGRISQLVSVVKDYSYVDRSSEQEIDVHEGIEKTLIILGHKLRAGVEVIREYDDHLPRVLAVGNELNQVWTNLIDNAIDAMDGHGQIRIRTSHDEEAAQVEIADSGPGIPEAVTSRIFDPFFTTKEVGKGTGLGLDIVRRLVVDRYRGEVTFESGASGTHFFVRLPLSS